MSTIYVRIIGGIFHAHSDDGLLAAGYKLYTYVAGTTTAKTTYSDRGLTAANTNPIILNSRGECRIFVDSATKLILTTPTGTPASPIWTEDYVGEQQDVSLVGVTTAGTANNNYVVTVTPGPASLTNGMELRWVPDIDNTDTLTSTVFTGTGINDVTFAGPYIGTTSASVFTVQIDASATLGATVFTGVGLNDGTFAGTPTVGGHTYTVEIDASVPSPDTFRWRRDSGSWTAGVGITGAAQTIADGVTITFGAVDGHTVGDYWQVTTSHVSPNTFRWKKDGGAWTSGVAITAVAQTLMEGITATFATTIGHTLNDIWALTVETAARLNLNGLGNKLIYKNIGSDMKLLSGGDLQANFPSTCVYTSSQAAWKLVDPSDPVYAAQIPQRLRKEITAANYTVLLADEGVELAFLNACTVTLPSCAAAAHKFFYLNNVSTGVITINVDGSPDLIILPENIPGASSMTLFVGGRAAIQLQTNGVNWHLLTQTTYPTEYIKITNFLTPGAATWTKTSGYTKVRVEVIGGGGGGGGSTVGCDAGGGGGAGGKAVEVIDVTAVTTVAVTVGAAGAAGAAAGGLGGTGGTSSFGAYCSATGGAGGTGSAVAPPSAGIGGVGGAGAGGDINAGGAPGGSGVSLQHSGFGGSTSYGGGGAGIGTAGVGVDGIGYGAGGSGAYPGGVNRTGGVGTPGIVIVTEFR